MSDNSFQGLRVMVSAGASGIGLEIAKAFLQSGARVEICDISESRHRSVHLLS